jgi:hypothetical protein
MKFVLLSTPNQWKRVLVGYGSEVFAISAKKLEELMSENMIEPPLSGGTFRVNPGGGFEISTMLRPQSFPLTIVGWNDPLIGLRTVCAIDESRQQWYLWKPI